MKYSNSYETYFVNQVKDDHIREEISGSTANGVEEM